MPQQRIRAYIWEFPVRFTHWINALCIATFSFTGFYIGHPFIYAVSTNQYIMGWMRFIHFASAYVFLVSIVIRIYWSFMGNKYASWRVFFPFTSERRRDLVGGLKFYALLTRKPPYAAGHTASAGIAYFFVFLLFLFEIFSGFGLYSVNHHGALWMLLGGWMLKFVELATLRLYHHLAMYVILAFTLIHVYIAWWLDSAEKNGLMMSIFSGNKFVTGKEWE